MTALPTTTVIRHALGWHHPDLSVFEFSLVIPGRSIMKKNSSTVRRFGDRASIGPSSAYQGWERFAADALARQWGRVFREPIPGHIELAMRVITYLPNRSGWPDLVATFEGPQDVLEAHKGTCKPQCRKHAGVIVNDRMICDHPGSDRQVDRDNPRVEITLTRFSRGNE